MPRTVTATWSTSAARRGPEQSRLRQSRDFGFDAFASPRNHYPKKRRRLTGIRVRCERIAGRYHPANRRNRNSLKQRVDVVLRGVTGVAVQLLAVQNRDFPLGAVDGVVNEIEFDLEFLALLDLGAIGFKQRLRIGNPAGDRRAAACRSTVTRADHLGTNGAQFAHDLAMH